MKKNILLALILFFITSCASENTNLDYAEKINVVDKIGEPSLDKAMSLYDTKDERILAEKQKVELQKLKEEKKRILVEKEAKINRITLAKAKEDERILVAKQELEKQKLEEEKRIIAEKNAETRRIILENAEVKRQAQIAKEKAIAEAKAVADAKAKRQRAMADALAKAEAKRQAKLAAIAEAKAVADAKAKAQAKARAKAKTRSRAS